MSIQFILEQNTILARPDGVKKVSLCQNLVTLLMRKSRSSSIFIPIWMSLLGRCMRCCVT